MNLKNPLMRCFVASAIALAVTSFQPVWAGAAASVSPSALPSAQAGLAWQADARLEAPLVDLDGLRAYEQQPKLGQPMRYGVVQTMGRVLMESGAARSGRWNALPDGRLSWRAEIHSSDAASLEATFSTRSFPASAEIYLSNADGSYVLGPIRDVNRSPDGRFYTPLVPGDVARIEVVVAADDRDAVDLTLESVTHAYRGLFGLDSQASILSGSCNIDVTCPEGAAWQDQIDSVGQYIFQSGGSSYVCTGSLIATTAGTSVPYFLTANHCISTAAVASTIRVYWKYESATCRAPGSAASGTSLPRPATYSAGSTLKANYAASDFSLLELTEAVPATQSPFFSGWDKRDQGAASAVSIHHPSGHEKRISRVDQALPITAYLSNTVNAASTHLRIIAWNAGTTEGGSSGSALFSPEKRIIGQLHGGYASCSSNTSDWYGRIATSWNGGGTAASRLSNWLDPTSSGATTLDGYRTAVADPLFSNGFD